MALEAQSSHPLLPSLPGLRPGQSSSVALEKLNESLWLPSQGHAHCLTLSSFYCWELRIVFSGQNQT